MIYKKVNFRFVKILFFLFFFSLVGCIDPIEPEFDLKEGTLYVDAFITTTENASFVKITKSVIGAGNSIGRFRNEFVTGADISFRNVDSGEVVILEEQEDAYVPPSDFVAAINDSWELLIVLSDGTQYQSSPEKIIKAVEIADIKATYNPELVFREDSNKFAPGHFISIDFDDPADENNYYFWNYRSFERLTYCDTCTNSVLRGGVCVENPYRSSRFGTYKFGYVCETDCWQIRYSSDINIFSDEFTNGNSVNGIPVANVLLFNKQDIVVRVEQFSISAAAYEYNKIIKDLVDNNGSFNAPPPAALIGNMFNPNDQEEFVLGRFSAAATTTKSVFIDRTDIIEPNVLPLEFIEIEDCQSVCPPGTCPPLGLSCPVFTSAECTETRFRTGIEPEGWIEQN